MEKGSVKIKCKHFIYDIDENSLNRFTMHNCSNGSKMDWCIDRRSHFTCIRGEVELDWLQYIKHKHFFTSEE